MIGGGISVWVPVISAGAGILGALGSQWLSHIFITKRERRSSEEKRNRERYFIATEIVFLLERFAQACVEPAEEPSELDDEGYITTLHEFPPFDYTTVTGDWRALPDDLIYKLSEFPVKHEEARRRVNPTRKKMTSMRDIMFGPLQTGASSLGLSALRLSRELRVLCGMPEDEMSEFEWSTWNVLEGIHHRSIDSFLKEIRSDRQSEAEPADSQNSFKRESDAT
ncbi:hypothetical protein [Pantoea agglomerans]|uniref:hypothetical protein n=1 Tax=Enterobacter agglomerans TaxID=549 RepID=UPI00045D4FB0|nr:hypothetical protein [Pantoea agglomerans]KDA94262.1 hypothetical protein T296_11695 [Pantoea agglomerans Eh318]